jgi:hypothetical protein
MDEFIASLFGSAPDYSSAMSPAQMKTMQQNALAQGGIGALIALLGASGPQARPIGTGQALAGALGAGFGGYQSSFDNTLKQMLTAQQLGEVKRKQQKEAAFEQAMAGATTNVPQPIPMATGPTSQLGMLSLPEFGGDMAAAETVNALRGNLPTTPRIDFDKFVQAIASSGINPIEAAKLMAPKEGKEKFTVMTAQQKQDFGLPADRSFQIGSSGKIDEISKGPLAVATNIVDARAKETSKIRSKAVEGYFDRAGSARQMAIASSTVADILENSGGGKAVQIGTDLSRALGLGDKGTIAAADAAAALVTQTAVKVRPEGSGSTSNIEFEAYRQSVPSLANSPQGRRFMATINNSFADRNELLADYAADLYEQGKFSLKAMREFDKSLGPILPPDFKAQVDAIKGAPSGGGAAPRLDLSQPAKPR